MRRARAPCSRKTPGPGASPSRTPPLTQSVIKSIYEDSHPFNRRQYTRSTPYVRVHCSMPAIIMISQSKQSTSAVLNSTLPTRPCGYSVARRVRACALTLSKFTAADHKHSWSRAL